MMARATRRTLLAFSLLACTYESSTLASERLEKGRLGSVNLPAANYVQFTRIVVELPGASRQRRHLLETLEESSDFSPTEDPVTVLVEERVVRACGRLLDERFERRQDCPLLPVSARAQREIASAEAAPCVSADGPLDARCSGGAGACAALCIGTLRCKSWNFRHPTTGWGSEISDQGRRALSMSRSSGRAPVRRSNSHGSSSRGSGGGGRGSSRSNGSGYNASFSGKPRSASGEAVTAHCQLFGFTMRGTAVAGLSAAAALGLGKGSRWSSGDIDRPAIVIRNATIYGGRVCDCGSSLRTRLFRGDDDGSSEYSTTTTTQPGARTGGGNDPRVLRRTVGSASQATACLELFDECKAEREGRLPWPSEIGCSSMASLQPARSSSSSSGGLTQRPLTSIDASFPSSSSTVSEVQHIDGTVVALGQMWGDKVFHFMVESLARWATLPSHWREHASQPSTSRHRQQQKKRSRSSSSGSLLRVHLGPTFATNDRAQSSTSLSSSATFKRQVELLGLVGVPFNSIVRDIVRATKVIVPNSVTCGTPTHFQVLSLRRLLLKAPPLLAHLRAQVARHQPSDVALGDTAVGPTTSVGSLATSRRRLGLISALNVHKWLPGHKPNREHILYSQSNESASLLNQLPETHVAAIDGLRSYSSNLRSNHERSSNSDEFNSNSHSGSRSSDSLKDGTGRSTGTGRRPGRSGDDVFHDLQLDPAIKRLWSLPASIDILVIERTRTRSLVNHAALVDALQHWAPPVDAPQVGEGGLGGQAGRVSSTSSDWLPLTLRVFSDRSSTAKRARTEGHSSSSSGENDSGAWSSQAEVLALFASAAVVIAPHGAGLANMLVMRPCTTVIEARTASHPRCYEHLANRLGFFYHSACSTRSEQSAHRVSVMKNTCPLAAHVNITEDSEVYGTDTTHMPMHLANHSRLFRSRQTKPPHDHYAMVADVPHVVQHAANAALAARQAAYIAKVPVEEFSGKAGVEKQILTRVLACQAAAMEYTLSHALVAEIHAPWAETFVR